MFNELMKRIKRSYDKVYDNITIKKYINKINSGEVTIENLINNNLVDGNVKTFFEDLKELFDKVHEIDIDSVKHYSNVKFDEKFNEFIDVYNKLSDMGLSFHKLDETKKEFDRINYNKIVKFYKELKRLSSSEDFAVSEEKQEKYKKRLSEIELCEAAYKISNKKVKVQSEYAVKIGTFSKEKLEIIKQKSRLVMKNAKERVKDTASRLPDPKDIDIVIGTRLEQKEKSYMSGMISDEEAKEMIDKAKATTRIEEKEAIVAELRERLKERERLGKKVKLNRDLQKVCSIPRNVFQKVKENSKLLFEKAKTALDNIRNKAKDMYNKGNDYLTDTISSFGAMSDNELEEKINAEMNAKLDELLASNVGVKGKEEIIKDVLSTSEEMTKENDKNMRKAKLVGIVQKIYNLPREVVERIMQNRTGEIEVTRGATI